jgi:hypothetical protein
MLERVGKAEQIEFNLRGVELLGWCIKLINEAFEGKDGAFKLNDGAWWSCQRLEMWSLEKLYDECPVQSHGNEWVSRMLYSGRIGLW